MWKIITAAMPIVKRVAIGAAIGFGAYSAAMAGYYIGAESSIKGNRGVFKELDLKTLERISDSNRVYDFIGWWAADEVRERCRVYNLDYKED